MNSWFSFKDQTHQVTVYDLEDYRGRQHPVRMVVEALAREAAHQVSAQLGGKRVRVIERVIGSDGVPSCGVPVYSTRDCDVLPVLH